MALHCDNSAANQYSDCVSNAAIDGWTALTIGGWYRATTLCANNDIRRIGAKQGSGGVGTDLGHAWNSGASIPQDCLRIRVNRATTAAEARTPAGGIILNEWAFVAGTYEETDGPRLFKGTQTSVVSEISTYDIRTVGSGATSSDASGSLRWGNRVFTPSAPNGIVGDLAFGFYIKRNLIAAELATIQFNPLAINQFGEIKAYYLFGNTNINSGTGLQLDLSGRGNHGLLTGTPYARSNEPLRFYNNQLPSVLKRNLYGPAPIAAGRTAKNTRSNPLGIEAGMGWRMNMDAL